MKIEDAIKRYESWADDDRIDVLIRKEHRQMADWLKELKTDKPQGKWIDKGWHGDWQFETDGRGIERTDMWQAKIHEAKSRGREKKQTIAVQINEICKKCKDSAARQIEGKRYIVCTKVGTSPKHIICFELTNCPKGKWVYLPHNSIKTIMLRNGYDYNSDDDYQRFLLDVISRFDTLDITDEEMNAIKNNRMAIVNGKE